MPEPDIPAVLERAAALLTELAELDEYAQDFPERFVEESVSAADCTADAAALRALAAQWPEYEAAMRLVRARWEGDLAAKAYRQVPEGPSLVSSSPAEVAAREPIWAAWRRAERAWRDYCGARRQREAALPTEDVAGG